MEICFAVAEIEMLEDCKSALSCSKLGRVYFSDDSKARQAIKEGITKGEIVVAINDKGICLGFVWYIMDGAFHSFPYLHIIAVKDEYRNQGIGKKLLEYFEKVISKDKSKVFLVVADFNPEAKRLYQSIGYREVGIIPNLYKTGVTEHLMMKELMD